LVLVCVFGKTLKGYMLVKKTIPEKELVTVFVQDIVEVIYSPVKAFKKIVAKPEFKAVILLFALFAVVGMVSQYMLYSKLNVETRTPSDDGWCQALTDGHVWLSSGTLTVNSTNFKVGTVDLNNSIVASSVNVSDVWLQVTEFGSLNCSGEDGFVDMFFWLRWVCDEAPVSGSVKLFSGSVDNYFVSNITGSLGGSREWVNVTLPVGGGDNWTAVGSADWQDIVGVEFDLGWASAVNSKVNVDGLFLWQYVSPIESGLFVAELPYLLFSVVLNTAMNWILWAGILILVAKLFNVDLGRWNVFFVVFGYSFIAMVVYSAIDLLPLSALPALAEVPLDSVAFSALLDATWRPLLAYQLWLYIPIVGMVWVAGLGAVAVHAVKAEEELPWGKAGMIAAVAFVIRFLLILFLGF